MEQPAAPPPAPDNGARQTALRVALVYALCAALWILGSDALLGSLVHDPQWLVQAEALKGWAFVATTSTILYVLALRRLRGPGPVPIGDAAPRQPREASQRVWFAGLATTVVGLTVVALFVNHNERRAQQVQRIEAVAAQHAAQVGTWFSYRQSQARFVRSSTFYVGLYQRWRQGDAAALAQLMERLAVMREAFGHQAAMVFDAQGELAAAEPTLPSELSAALQARVRQALATGEIQQQGGSDEATGKAWMDMVVPVLGNGAMPVLAMVLRVDLEDFLLPMLRTWPSATRTGETLLVRRDGDMLMGMLGAHPIPVDRPGLLAGRVLLGQAPLGAGAEGQDFRGVPVFGAVRDVPGTGWLLVAKMDLGELRAESLKGTVWIAATGALALLGGCVALVMLRERRALEAARAQRADQEERLRALALVQAIAEGSNDAIFAKDLQGLYILCNQEAAHVLGGTPQDILGTGDGAHLPATQAAALRANDARVIAEGRVLTYEEELTTSQGTCTFLATKGPLRDDEGRVIGMFGISRDITERKRAELALRDATALVQAVTDSVLDHMAVLDSRGTIVMVNAAWDRFAADNGFCPVPSGHAAAPGPDYLAMCHAATGPDAAQAAAAAQGIAAVIAGRQTSFSLEYPCHSPRQERWFHMTVTPLNTQAGGAVVVHGDVTERYLAQAQLRKLSLAVEQSPMAITIRDTEGRIEYVNDAFTRISGFSREEAVSQLGHVLQPDRAPLQRKQLLWDALQRGETWCGEFQSRRKDGMPYHELVHAAPIRQPDGRITHHLWIGEDVTVQKRTAAELDRHRHQLQELVDERTQQLRQANAELVDARDRADAANQAKSAFLANMSHEIRTPLNAILGLTHLLRRDAHDAMQAERLARVNDAAGHLLQVVNDVLDLSKIESGRLELEETDFSLGALLAGAQALVAGGAQAKGLQLSLDAGDTPDALRGDPTRLSQALLNLLSNAVKFTERGLIAVHAEVQERGERGLRLCLRVRDTGIGIAPDKLAQIFDAFVQSDPSTTRRFGGTGLGLAITQRLAAMMGGEAGVRSEPGMGSEFWFSAWVREAEAALPAATRDLRDAEADAAALRQHCHGARVLLAEDNPMSQGLTLELLHWAGLEVELANDGREAVAAATARHHDLILLDVQMPGMDGLEAARRIRALPAHAATPIVALTANVFAQQRALCLQAGMDDHVPKPVDPPQLFATLLRWLAGPARDAAASALRGGQQPPVAADTAAPLPAIAGLDAARALRYLGGHAGLYRRVLEQFLQHFGTELPAARAQLAGGDTTALAALAHTLAGSSEPVGATALAQRARALERVLAEGASASTLAAAAESLLDELERLLGNITRALAQQRPQEEVAAAEPGTEPGATNAQVEELAQLLRDGDYRAMAHWRALAPALRREHPATVADVEARLLGFDFEEALAVVEGLRRA